MDDTRIENAKIASVFVGNEDHGILTMFLHIEGNGWGVGCGGYALDSWDEKMKRRVGWPLLAEAVIELLRVFEVNGLDQLKGLPCRAETNGWGGRCKRIGHFTKNKWFDWEVLCQRVKANPLGASVLAKHAP